MIYAISDIHGSCSELARWITQFDNVGTICLGADKLVFLGDYIDRGPDSFKTLELIRSIQLTCGKENCIVLRGNHEDWFLDFLDGNGDEWLVEDTDLSTSKTFLSEEQLDEVKQMALSGDIDKIYGYIRRCINENHKDLISWVQKLPYYYETENQIFVHAGIDEEAGDWWNTGTPEHVFTGKYPPTKGEFYKDIIAGHTAACSVAGDKDFQGIYYDGQSHYYIDGSVDRTGMLLCLAYNEKSGEYYELEREEKLVEKTGKICGILKPL